MSLLLGRGALALVMGARQGVLPTAAFRPPRRLGGPTALIDLVANPTPRVSVSMREFGKKSRGKQRDGKHKELGYGMSKAMQGRMKLKERAKVKELKERLRLAKLEADPNYKPPVIPHRMDKGPESWDIIFANRSRKKRWAEMSMSLRTIEERDSHLKGRIQHVLAEIKEAGYGWKDDQLKEERLLTSLHYDSRLDYMNALNDYKSKIAPKFVQWKESQWGESNLPTIVPGVDNTFQLPMSPSTVRSVKKGQMVVFLLHAKRRLPTTPESFRYIHSVRKRIAALEGDVVEFQGKKYTVPKDHFWALGDNPKKSGDSRHFGAVPLQNIRARTLFTFRGFPPRVKSVTK